MQQLPAVLVEEWTRKFGPFKTAPFGAHQLEDLARGGESKHLALFWEMGLGKSWELINTCAHLRRRGLLDGLLLVAPNGVHLNFAAEEMPPHWPDDVPVAAHTWRTERVKTKRHQQEHEAALYAGMPGAQSFAVLAMSYDAIRTDIGMEAARRFLMSRRCMIALDESTAIKTPGAKISKRLMVLRKLVQWARIMDGTPLADGAFDVYNQLRFLEPDYWGRHQMSSFMVFKQTFGVFVQQRAAQGHQFPKFIEYRNLDLLQKFTKDISVRRLKEDCLDLPPKVYKKAVFALEPAQRKLYDQTAEQTRVEVASGQIEATMALTRLLRLQQIASGFVTVADRPPELPAGDAPPGSPEEAQARVEAVLAWHAGEHQGLDLPRRPPRIEDVVPPQANPRLRLLLEMIEKTHHKCIVFCRFTRDVDLIVEALGKKRAVRYDGKVGAEERERGLGAFRAQGGPQVLVANIAALSRGVTLTIAKTVYYYSNSFSLIHRLQSEDRAHRIGQDQSVLYVDLVAEDTVDGHIADALRAKFDVAALVGGDRLREWL